MPMLCSIINAAALIYGGIVDYKRREIPNTVPVALLATGLFVDDYIFQRLFVMLVIAVILWFTMRSSQQELPGGDFKLICALAFSTGLVQLLVTLFLSVVGAILISLIRNENVRRHVPLCTYVAPAYVLGHATLLYIF